MLDSEGVQALFFGLRVVRRFGDPVLVRASDAILAKVAAVLPADLEPLLAGTKLFVPTILSGKGSADGLAMAREALVARRRLRFRYANERGDASERTVRPLAVFFWGRTWTLAAWCEMRVGFRNFRVDRISEPSLGDTFEDEPGRTLRDLLEAYGPEAVKLLDR